MWILPQEVGFRMEEEEEMNESGEETYELSIWSSHNRTGGGSYRRPRST